MRQARPAGVTYTKPGCGLADCALYTESVVSSVHGQWRSHVSTLSTQEYFYDKAARLVSVQDIVSGQCNTRSYEFDTSTDRTNAVQYGPGAGGACQASAATTAQEWTYDSADRTIDLGYTYDSLGRTLTQPPADSAVTGGGSTFTYHVNDMAHTITQGSRSATYTLDVIPNRIRSWVDTANGVTKRNHYSGDNDSPTWTDEGGENSSRPIAGLVGFAGVFRNTTGIVWVVTNLHGDFVAGMNEWLSGLAYTSEYDEHGTARNQADVGVRRYGYLGGYQRAADTPDGSILMGARTYNPATGRFRSTDPVYGGNANPYEYCSGDPVNCADISGELSCYRTSKSAPWWSMWIVVGFRCDFSHWETTQFIAGWNFVAAIYTGIALVATLAGLKDVVLAFGLASAIAWIVSAGAQFWYGQKCRRQAGVYYKGNLWIHKVNRKVANLVHAGIGCR